MWGILVRECGASPKYAETFAAYMAEEGPKEYRFSGSLGFGGKFYANSNGWYVAYYREDRTKERDEAMQRANAAIRNLRAKNDA